MSVKAGYSTPMFHVAEIEKSLEFYERLGFETIDTDRCMPIGWARVHCQGGALMFLRAEQPRDSPPKDVMLCMYTPDLVELREQLLAAGINVPPIRFPGYMPSGEIQFVDPDGYQSSFPIGEKRNRKPGKSGLTGKIDKPAEPQGLVIV